MKSCVARLKPQALSPQPPALHYERPQVIPAANRSPALRAGGILGAAGTAQREWPDRVHPQAGGAEISRRQGIASRDATPAAAGTAATIGSIVTSLRNCVTSRSSLPRRRSPVGAHRLDRLNSRFRGNDNASLTRFNA